MARLNEPAAPTESIESLKRKFMRQNRDIARANSAQSLRIRNLENETSRLLAENLGLREEILRLQNDLENSQSQRILDHTGCLKSELETKLLEITALVGSLGTRPSRQKESRGGKATRTNPCRSPTQKDWKDAYNEALQDGRLPIILENKSYPRRTLEQQELVKIISEAVADTTDSPEIGPPPISQFVDGDPVKIDLIPQSRKQESDEIATLDPVLSANLEHRRKRKDSMGTSESKRASQADPSHGSRDNSTSLKSGAKRKLSVRDDDEEGVTSKQDSASTEDFTFTRVISQEKNRNRGAPQPDKSASKASKDLAMAKGAPREKGASNNTIDSAATRNALAPKSVNHSPKKSGRSKVIDDGKASKPENKKPDPAKVRSKESKPEPISVKLIQPEISPLQPEPETPAGLDLFSPMSSQPSTARAESRDTPPPPDLETDIGGHRPSRRARGAVSYAEPNLRDKMRRPSKQLIDAVGGDSKAQRSSIVKLEENERPTFAGMKIEPEADDAWKRMPVASSATVENSPLSSKAQVVEDLPETIITHRKRRESLLHDPEQDPSITALNLAELLAESRRASSKMRAGVKTKKKDEATHAVVDDIYEFKGSPSRSSEQRPTIPGIPEAPASRFSRRQSSATQQDPFPIEDSGASDTDASKKSTAATSRRRQSTLGLRSTLSSNSGLVNGEENREADQALRRAASTIGTTTEGGALDATSRGDRIAARRRSMML